MRYTLIFFAISGCSGSDQSKLEKYSEVQTMMGTFVRIDVCEVAGNEQVREKAYVKAWERLEDIAWRMNVFDDRSDVAKVNSSYEDPATIGADTYGVIKDGMKFYEMSDGAFDMTVWPLIQLWKTKAKLGELPSEDEVQGVLQSLGVKNIKLLSANRVQIAHPETRLDLGGIAKGYAVDEVARILREYDIQQFYIDAGGDLYVGGLNCSGEKWKIAIRNPYAEDKPLTIVSVTNQAVTTSGNYEQYLKVQDKTLSHIINPQTGYPQEGVISATVIAPTAQDADALSTALSVLGEEKAFQLIDSLGPQYGSLILSLKDEQTAQEFRSKEFEKFELK